MFQVSHQLSRAGQIDTVPGNFSLQMLHSLSAGRAGGGRNEGLLTSNARIDHRANHIRNDLSCPFDEDAVANADVLFGDVIEIVQGRLADDDSPDLDRFQYSERGQHPGPPDIDPDIHQAGGHFAGRELECQRPAWVLSHKSQFSRQIQIVDLENDAVCLKSEMIPLFPPDFDSL